MFKIGETPSFEANPIEHADFLEIECLRQSDRNASGADLSRALTRVADNPSRDRAISDEPMEAAIEAAFSELADRATHGGGPPHVYPFNVNEATQLIEYPGTRAGSWLYLLLLFATRMNMRADRVQDGINGTDLFERICCEVAKNYWGDRTQAVVFGTARRADDNEVGSFVEAVNELCAQMGEGVRFFGHGNAVPSAQDGNLDVVVWKPFSDSRVGKLIGFGQCKTGTHWKTGLFELVPEGFCKKWILTSPAVTPVRLFFLASRIRQNDWYDCNVDAGIIFDRCRILDYAPRMPDLMGDIMTWTRAAIASQGLRAI